MLKENKINIQPVINKLLNKYIMMLDTSDKATIFSLCFCNISEHLMNKNSLYIVLGEKSVNFFFWSKWLPHPKQVFEAPMKLVHATFIGLHCQMAETVEPVT